MVPLFFFFFSTLFSFTSFAFASFGMVIKLSLGGFGVFGGVMALSSFSFLSGGLLF